MSKRALWATSTASPANSRKRRTASSTGGAPRKAPGSIPVSAAIGAGSGRRGLTSVSKRSSSSSPLTRTAPISQIAEEPGERPVVSRSNDDVGGVLERQRSPGRIGEADARAAPGEPRVAVDDVREQRTGEPDRNVTEGVERLRRVLGGHRPVARLHELDQPVGGVERQLHAGEPRRTYVRLQAQREGRDACAAFSILVVRAG